MITNSPRVNPLFSSSSAIQSVRPDRSQRAAQRAVKFGGYGGMAVAAWLVTAVATGYGVSTADTTDTASDSSSVSSSSSSPTVKASSVGTSTGSAPTSVPGGSTPSASTKADGESAST